MAARSQRMSGAIFLTVTLFALVALAASALEFSAVTLATRSIVNGRPGVETASRISPLSWSFPLVLAEIAAGTGRSEEAVAWYRKALRRNPACAQCAVGLAEVEAKLGRDPQPWLETAVRYGRSTTAIRMRTGTLYARLGMQERAAEEFRAAASGQRENQREFFVLLHRIYPDWFVLDKILPDRLVPSYFSFARARLGPFAVQRAWQRYREFGAPPSARDEYVAYLLRHGFAHEAWSLAFDGRPPPLGTVLNGDFETPVSGHGLSWRIADAEGVKARVVDCADCPGSGRALVLRFDGETNVQYAGTRLYVAVEPSTVYRLSARVKADGITSARGPSLAVTGLRSSDESTERGCELYVTGEELRRSFDWRTTSLIFTSPEACTGIEILVTRPRTRRLDKFLGGELWIDDVALETVSTAVAAPTVGESSQDGTADPAGDRVAGAPAPAQPEVGTPSR